MAFPEAGTLTENKEISPKHKERIYQNLLRFLKVYENTTYN